MREDMAGRAASSRRSVFLAVVVVEGIYGSSVSGWIS